MKTEKQVYYAEYYKKNKDRHVDNMKRYKEDNADHFKQYQLEYSKKKYYKNKENTDVEALREEWRIKKNKINQQRRDFINDYKLTCSCKKCNDNRFYILDFHHINPEKKDFNLGDATKYSIDKLKTELEKCITLCRNCHSEFHYLEKEKGININEYLSKTQPDA